MKTVEDARQLLTIWADHLGESAEGIHIEIEDLNTYQPEEWPPNEGLGATWHHPNGTEHRISISPICPDDKFEEVVLHEFLHVLCDRNEPVLEEYMVNMCAQVLVALREERERNALTP